MQGPFLITKARQRTFWLAAELFSLSYYENRCFFTRCDECRSREPYRIYKKLLTMDYSI